MKPKPRSYFKYLTISWFTKTENVESPPKRQLDLQRRHSQQRSLFFEDLNSRLPGLQSQGVAKLSGSNASDVNSSTLPQERVQPAKRTRAHSLCSRPAKLNSQGRCQKRTKTPFFPYAAIEKAVQTVCSGWTRLAAMAARPRASWVTFARCALPSLPAGFTSPPGSARVSWLCSTAAPQVQGCTHGSNQPFREKKCRRRKKNAFFSLWPPVRPH